MKVKNPKALEKKVVTADQLKSGQVFMFVGNPDEIFMYNEQSFIIRLRDGDYFYEDDKRLGFDWTKCPIVTLNAEIIIY